MGSLSCELVYRVFHNMAAGVLKVANIRASGCQQDRFSLLYLHLRSDIPSLPLRSLH